MRRTLAICVILLLPLAMVLADTAQILAQADDLHDKGQYAEAKQAILDALPGAASGAEKAELFWRAARETLELGDKAEEAKQPAAAILKFFEEGEGYANKAIEADPRNDLGYYWKSSNIGRWGQIKGILNSLAKAAPMKELLVKVVGLNPERSDAYYVLGQLYRELPGGPCRSGTRMSPSRWDARPSTCARGRSRPGQRRPSRTATTSSWRSPCTSATGLLPRAPPTGRRRPRSTLRPPIPWQRRWRSRRPSRCRPALTATRQRPSSSG